MESSKLRHRSHLPLTTQDESFINININNGGNNNAASTAAVAAATTKTADSPTTIIKDHLNSNNRIFSFLFSRIKPTHRDKKQKQEQQRSKNNKQGNSNNSILKRILFTTVCTYFVWRWMTQLIDYVQDNQRLETRKKLQQIYQQQQQWGAESAPPPPPPILLYDTIPRIPTINWPVFTRWLFRPHNAQIVHGAQMSIEEFGNDLRQNLLLQTTQNPEEEESQSSQPIPSINKANLKWLKQRAPWLKFQKKDHDDDGNNFLLLPTPTTTIIDGKAIVISAGDKQLHYVKTLVYTIRIIHKCHDIPIRIVYRDWKDLSIPAQEEIRKVVQLPPDVDNSDNANANNNNNNNGNDIDFINLSNYFDLDVVDLKGWNLKAFGLLVVPFAELVILDADVMLLQSPAHLFRQKGYLDTGVLFFHDRVKPQFYWNVHTILEWLTTTTSTTTSSSSSLLLSYGYTPSTSYYSEQIQEAGLFIINKNRKSIGLWAACLLFGRPDIRKYIQMDHMYGDKEVYWLAMETLKQDYAFATYYPGVIGGTVTDFASSTTHLKVVAVVEEDEDNNNNNKNKNNEAEEEDAEKSLIQTTYQNALTTDQALCGRLLHFDDDGKPLWANGGYMLKEDDWFSSEDVSLQAINPVYYLDGGKTGEVFPNPFQPFFRNLLQLYNTLRGENQVWALHKSLGVECLSPNSRHLQLVDTDVADQARKAVRYYFQSKFQKKKNK